MIKTETLILNGCHLIKTYSDSGMMVQNAEGTLYDVAIDPEESGRTYTESAIKIPEEITIAY